MRRAAKQIFEFEGNTWTLKFLLINDVSDKI